VLKFPSTKKITSTEVTVGPNNKFLIFTLTDIKGPNLLNLVTMMSATQEIEIYSMKSQIIRKYRSVTDINFSHYVDEMGELRLYASKEYCWENGAPDDFPLTFEIKEISASSEKTS
jgi:hypothetical protein